KPEMNTAIAVVSNVLNISLFMILPASNLNTALSVLLFHLSPLLRPHMRKQDDVADRVLVSDEHRKAVDADADPGGGRHPVTQRPDIILVEHHRLFIAAFALLHLVDEPLILFTRVVQLRKAVSDLHPVNEQL